MKMLPVGYKTTRRSGTSLGHQHWVYTSLGHSAPLPHTPRFADIPRRPGRLGRGVAPTAVATDDAAAAAARHLQVACNLATAAVLATTLSTALTAALIASLTASLITAGRWFWFCSGWLWHSVGLCVSGRVGGRRLSVVGHFWSRPWRLLVSSTKAETNAGKKRLHSALHTDAARHADHICRRVSSICALPPRRRDVRGDRLRFRMHARTWSPTVSPIPTPRSHTKDCFSHGACFSL